MKLLIFPEIYVHDVAESVRLFQVLFEVEIFYQQSDFAELRIGESRLLLNALNMGEFEAENPVRQPVQQSTWALV